MAKRAQKSRRTRREESRGTNWLLIGGIVVVGLVALFALLFLTLQEQDSPQPTQEVVGQPLEEYCQENPGNCVSEGDDNAPITIVEVSDYGCSHCKNFNLETAGLLRDLYITPGQVKWVVMPFALGPQTAPASAAAMCAGEQDSFFDYHHRLFELQGDPQFMTSASFRQAAEDVGLDMDAFNACLQDGQYNNTIQQNVAAATAVGVNSTPSFFVNGVLLRGNQPLTAFQQQINTIIGDAGASQ
jgi:protein-disulfide isomerase